VSQANELECQERSGVFAPLHSSSFAYAGQGRSRQVKAGQGKVGVQVKAGQLLGGADEIGKFKKKPNEFAKIVPNRG
jgi:hypothetical protein